MRFLAGLAAVYLWLTPTSSFGDPPSEATSLRVSGYALPRPLTLQPFRLTDQHGNEFTRDHLSNRWTLLFFGYTHCPDVCPTTLAQLRAVTKLLSQDPDPVRPAVVFVSVDPRRDSARQLNAYLEPFGTDFTGVGGEPRAIEAFAQQFRAKYTIAGDTASAYLIDHTSAVALINPNAELHALFSVPLRPEAVAAEIRRLTKPSLTER
jgi:protein SCO1/2